MFIKVVVFGGLGVDKFVICFQCHPPLNLLASYDLQLREVGAGSILFIHFFSSMNFYFVFFGEHFYLVLLALDVSKIGG